MNRKKISEKERLLIAKILFKRFSEGKATSREKRIVERLQSDYFQQKKKESPQVDLKEIEKRQRDFLAERISFEPQKEQQRKKLRPWITYSGVAVAAVALLLIALNLPLFDNGELVKDGQPLVVETVISNQFITERNMKRVTLADGSVVHMNMGTTLSLREGKFNAHTREVWLDEGEAFFEVTKDPNRPFIVHTADGLSTRVLGTSFNIKAYRELNEQVVSVKTGRVQVGKKNGDKVILDPDNKAAFNTITHQLTSGMTDGTVAADWRKGYIAFQEAGFSEVAFRVKQYYEMEVISKNNAVKENIRLDIAFSVNTPLKQIASEIAQIYNVKYKITETQLIFFR